MAVFILAHSLRVQSAMAGKAWRQEREAAGHIAPSGSREVNAGDLQHIQSGTPAPEVAPSAIKVDLHPTIIARNSHTDMPEALSPG